MDSTQNSTESIVLDKSVYLGYGPFYNMFFGVGLSIIMVIVVLMTWIGFIKQFHRYNPFGILFHILLVQLFLACRIFLVGLFYQIWDFSFLLE